MILHVNLLPYREARREKMIQKILIAWGMTVALGVGGIIMTNSMISDHVLEQKAIKKQKQATIAQLDAKLGEIKDINVRKQQVKARLAVIETLGLQRNLPVHLLEAISTAIPDKVWLREISTTQNTITISGFTLSNAMVADFMRKLDSSDHITNVNLNNIAQSKLASINNKLRNFKLSANIVLPTPQNQPAPGKRRGRR
ncbi:MAG: PilN domain-containing protein [Magnetococcales bacterium]|nr:PilN domain-containing protein [Magnetococcales bacterium]